MTFSRQTYDNRLRARIGRKALRMMAPGLARIGYEQRREILEQLSPIDLRGIVADPAEALKRAGGLRFVIDIPLAQCRAHRAAAFPCLPGSGHPYLETARGILSGRVEGFAGSPLERYYRHFRPESVAAYLGITATNAGLSAPAAVMTFPWDPPPDEGTLARRLAQVAKENRQHGLKLGAGHGFHHFGPVSAEKGELEFSRLASVLDHIQTEGFRLLGGQEGLPRARILSAGETFAAMISNGQHRIAALGALDAAAAPIWPLPDIVRREEVLTWPGVQAGLFAPAQALAVFDRVLEGRQPDCLEAEYWLDGALPAGRQGSAAH